MQRFFFVMIVGPIEEFCVVQKVALRGQHLPCTVYFSSCCKDLSLFERLSLNLPGSFRTECRSGKGARPVPVQGNEVTVE